MHGTDLSSLAHDMSPPAHLIHTRMRREDYNARGLSSLAHDRPIASYISPPAHLIHTPYVQGGLLCARPLLVHDRPIASYTSTPAHLIHTRVRRAGYYARDLSWYSWHLWHRLYIAKLGLPPSTAVEVRDDGALSVCLRRPGRCEALPSRPSPARGHKAALFNWLMHTTQAE